MTLRIESVAIGDELLDGRVGDGNSKDLGDALAVLGLSLVRAAVVSDDRALIIEAITEAARRSDIVVTSGGLGPTTDDITAESIAQAAGVGMRTDEPALARMVAMFEGRGLHMPENNKRQAELPASSTTLENEAGTAPGFVTPLLGAHVWSFPGVPREYQHLLHDRLVPALKDRLAAGREVHVVKRTLRCLGITESALGERIEPLEKLHPDVRVQYRTMFPENLLRLVVTGPVRAEVEARADALALEAKALVGNSVYAMGDTPLEVLVVDALKAAGATLSTTESCTGGLIAKRITDVSGSSAVFAGGAVTYANDAKVRMADVPQALLDAHGAVSEPVAIAMAEGLRARLSSTIGISTTGIAGPSGGTADKPVGLVCFAIATPSGTRAFTKKLPNFGRERIRETAAATLLRALLDELHTLPKA